MVKFSIQKIKIKHDPQFVKSLFKRKDLQTLDDNQMTLIHMPAILKSSILGLVVCSLYLGWPKPYGTAATLGLSKGLL
jgi:hypothetical protein